MARFDEERRLLLERYEALDAENAELRGALLAAQHRAEEAAFTADQLRGNLERSRALGLAVRGAGSREGVCRRLGNPEGTGVVVSKDMRSVRARGKGANLERSRALGLAVRGAGWGT
jgi:hypothetical protein